MTPITSAFDAAAVCVLLLLIYRYFTSKPSLPLPPGPRRLPLIGNLLDVPKELSWKQYTRWAQMYGDVMSLSVLDQTIVVLSSHDAIKNFVLSRPASFSGRPLIKFVEMAGWDRSNLPLMNWGSRWKDRRRIVDAYFRPAALQDYQHSQVEKASKLMKRIIEKPTELSGHTREYTGAVIMDVVYGYDAKDRSDYFIRLNEDFQSFAPSTILPGALIVNTFPFLGRLPPWMLGNKFATLLEKSTRMQQQVLEEPFKWFKNSIKNGTARDSLVRKSLSDLGSEASEEEESVIADAFGSVFAAAIDTTTSTLMSFIINMILNPEIQIKAREELDAVVGRDRLPGFQDRLNLPYIDAIFTEVFRWEPTTPLGVPHSVSEDTVFDQYFIPKGSILIGNAWAILHDPERFPEPDVFKPERHLSADGKFVEDPLLEYAFGFGSRRCPGRHFADAMMWLYIVSVLSLFDISKAKDEHGNDIPVTGEFESQNLVHVPLPFSCRLVPRDKQAVELISSL